MGKVYSPCRECGVDTTPCSGRDGPLASDRWDWYMVVDDIWRQAGGGAGYLCIACLELLIGRPLRRPDFTGAPVNIPWLGIKSDRLLAALARG